ncbi:hypothetical protein [Campylobacter sp.]|uniref:hypothetical protein n=1 Tax=Campylobacter sp. TaxID=205 RepID=UPI002A53E13A|nr:hypothetical protein [Campylobacter sp.]MDD7090697.1 hypothetical protein [Campylobacteraceae bacterium]MDY5285310.1 hypothetical protein [Campylobacter sp.]
MKNARGAGGALLRFCPAGRLAGSACGAIFYAHSLRSPAAYAEASACFPLAYALKNCRRTSANATATPPHG